MDLPSCPSCRQSVLDDEAENCPFCGASLKGGASRPVAKAPPTPARPSTRPASPAPYAKPLPQAASKTTAPKAAASSGPATGSSKSPILSRESSPPMPSGGDAADPFALEIASGASAVVVSRQRTQAKPHKVVCPMCETAGYVPLSAAGRDVRCANPRCLVPIFTAPKVQKKIADDVPPKSTFPMWLMVPLAIVVVVGGAAAWYLLHKAPAKTPANGSTNTAQGDATKPAPTKTNGPPAEAKDSKAPVAPVERAVTLADERETVLALISKASQDRDRNRSMEFCERVVAKTAADCGDLKTARMFVEPLLKNKSGLVFYSVGPLTSIVWQQLKGGDRIEAAKTLDEALKAASELPTVGRYSIDTSAQLAAALVAAGRDRDAQALIDQHPAAGPTGRLFAVMASAAAWNTWDVEIAAHDRPLLDAASLQGPAVVEAAAARGYPAEALRFAQRITDPALRTECEIAWIDAAARLRQLESSAGPILARFSPAAQARAQARAGTAALRLNDRAAADKALQAALSAVGKIVVGEEFVFPTLKELATLEPADAAPARQKALALAEISRLEAALNKRDDARTHLEQALAVMRASAPSPVAAQERLNDLSKRGARTLRSDLAKILKLKNDDQANAALNTYRNHCNLLLERGESRLRLETEILQTALSWADTAALWEEIEHRATEAGSDRREPYFDTALPALLAAKLEMAGDASAAAKIRKAADEKAPPPAALLATLVATVGRSDPSALVKEIESVGHADKADVEWTVLVGMSRLLRAHKVGEAFQFVRVLKDQVLKEEALQWTAALSCRQDLVRDTKAILLAANFAPTETVCVWRGFLMGLTSLEQSKAAGPQAEPGAAPKEAEKSGRL